MRILKRIGKFREKNKIYDILTFRSTIMNFAMNNKSDPILLFVLQVELKITVLLYLYGSRTWIITHG